MEDADQKKNLSRRRRGIYLLPNIITTGSLFCGFYSIVQAINGDYVRAAWAILFAGIFDLLDGRIARLTRTHSDFGIAYDSLCDLASFGLAPAVLAYTWTLNQFGKFGWAVAFLLFACGALRLARYNTQMTDVEKKHFQGLPIPCAAAVVAGYVIFHFRWKGNVDVASYMMFFMAFALAFLMVSNVRYRSFKSLNLKRKQSFLFLVGIAVALFVVASAPSVMIFLFSLLYVASGLAEELFYQSRRKHLLSGDGLMDPDGDDEQEPFRVIDGKM